MQKAFQLARSFVPNVALKLRLLWMDVLLALIVARANVAKSVVDFKNKNPLWRVFSWQKIRIEKLVQ